jgi:hypothetical protein
MSNLKSEMKTETQFIMLRRPVFLLVACLSLLTVPAMAEFTITAPANHSVYCWGNTIGAGQITVYSDCAAENGTPVHANLGGAAVNMTGYSPNYQSAENVTLEEAGWITISADNDCGNEDSVDIAVVRLVTAGVNGAAYCNADNWAAVKTASETDFTEVYAELIPNDTTVAIAALSWSGGESGTDPSKRYVHKNDSKKTTVTLTCCSGTYTFNIWILWATLEIRSSDTVSPGNTKSFTSGEGGNGLGAFTDEDDGITQAEAIGKIEAVATLSPPGVYAVITEGWDIKRWVQFKDYTNGVLSASGDRDDTSYPSSKDLIPDSDDKIYDIDGPTCGQGFNITLSHKYTKETYNNFWQWVTWNETKCSDSLNTWHYQARVDDDLDPTHRDSRGAGNEDTELNDVGWGMINIPNTASYSPRPYH